MLREPQLLQQKKHHTPEETRARGQLVSARLGSGRGTEHGTRAAQEHGPLLTHTELHTARPLRRPPATWWQRTALDPSTVEKAVISSGRERTHPA